MLTGIYFISVFLQRKIKSYVYLLFAILCMVVIKVIPNGRIIEFAVYVMLLMAVGIFVCHADWKSVLLYAALTVEIMQLCYGIVNSLSGILYPVMSSWNQKVVGIILMLAEIWYHCCWQRFVIAWYIDFLRIPKN